VEPINGANGANGDMTDAKWSHLCPNFTAKQHKKRSQNGANVEPIEGSIGSIGSPIELRVREVVSMGPTLTLTKPVITGDNR